jgi:hypothetical protein
VEISVLSSGTSQIILALVSGTVLTGGPDKGILSFITDSDPDPGADD